MAKKSRNRVEFKAMAPSMQNVDKPADMSLVKQHKKKAQEKLELSSPGLVISRANHPVDFQYDGETHRMSPRGKQKVADISKLGKLDKNLVVKKL